MNKKHEMPALMFFTMWYLTNERMPTLEEFLFAGYSKTSYYRTKRDFNAKKFILLKDTEKEDVKWRICLIMNYLLKED